MIHQPMGGTGRQRLQASDIAIEAKEILRVRQELNEMMALHTGKPIEQIEKDTDRDYFMSAEEAVAYGLIDRVIEDRNQELASAVAATA
jgi:ATP-dependent Clp protease protease subunit